MEELKSKGFVVYLTETERLYRGKRGQIQFFATMADARKTAAMPCVVMTYEMAKARDLR